MTRNELLRERWIEKQRAKIVKAEIARTKRAEQIKSHVTKILEWMSLIAVLALTIVAFTIDAFGFASIPLPVYLLGIGYFLLYLFIWYWKSERRRK